MDDYESLMETPEILSDPKAMVDIRQAGSRMQDGEIHDAAQVRAAFTDRRR